MKKILILCITLVIFSCGNSEEKVSEDPADLNNLQGDYNLIALDGENISSEGFILNFNGKKQQLAGKTGCNNFVASYKIQDSIIKFNPPLGTKMYCEGEMEYEDTFNKILPKVRNLRISDKDLIFLSQNNEQLLNLEKQEQSE
ncbi:Heat shock protein HslJ [Salegentibacter echinorum]|uniref:Heat shock protein HslJ n=1 Tax=Salegentibacter echinorum TaxID=1073325 RepID=A0A1M5EJ21_SALEC|nr:META domain-containing protein [Salegentibacter echinorum]SHF79239.1 Heat shock protein HslJ [Salegentibacter echinorum]